MTFAFWRGNLKMEQNNDINKKNSVQDIAIAQMAKDIEFIKIEITEIKSNHLKGINNEIKELKRELYARPTWPTTMLISTTMALISFGIAYFFVK